MKIMQDGSDFYQITDDEEGAKHLTTYPTPVHPHDTMENGTEARIWFVGCWCPQNKITHPEFV